MAYAESFGRKYNTTLFEFMTLKKSELSRHPHVNVLPRFSLNLFECPHNSLWPIYAYQRSIQPAAFSNKPVPFWNIFFKNPVILLNSKQLIEIELFAQEQQKEIFAKALQYWAEVSKLSFRSVESPSEADIKIR